MLGVVQRHDFLADVRLERIVRVWQRRKSVLSTYMRTQSESTHQASCINWGVLLEKVEHLQPFWKEGV